MGYVLPWGQMSFWGATVITNLLSPFPCLIEWVCGGHYVYNPTLKRFFLFHFCLPFLVLSLFIIHFPFGVYSLSHPDNALEVCGFVTPLHIVPEWYFLCQYAMLKAVPNKNAGFIVLCTSICIFFLFGEVRNLTSLTRSVHNNNGFSISFFYLSVLCILWIGAQFPQEKFLSYGRILTFYYYFILMCILVVKKKKKKKKKVLSLIPLL